MKGDDLTEIGDTLIVFQISREGSTTEKLYRDMSDMLEKTALRAPFS